jgi:DNA-binding MarR family transcriptional regulator
MPRQAAAPNRPVDPVLEFIRLMWSVDHELQRVSKRMVTRIGLTAPQRLSLRFIGIRPGLTPGALAGLLHVHPGTATGFVRHLEDIGLIRIKRSDEDTRRLHLELTTKGRVVNRRRSGTVEGAVRRVIERLTASELRHASDTMRRLAQELAAE